MFIKKLRVLSAAGAMLLAGLMPSAAGAYQVAPMIYDLKPSGQGATTTVRVQNDGDKPITVEVIAEKRLFDETGKESRQPADADFILFPPQAVIGAGKTQALRVQYVGKPVLSQSAMYVVTIKQLPVALPANGPSGVQFVFNFGTVANVVPDGAKADIQVASIAPASGGYALRLHNAGNKYANLSLGRLVLSASGKLVPVEGDTWRKSLGASWILPGGDRVIQLPAVAGVSGAVSAKYEAAAPAASRS
jgi:fimbrial chaperone protein